ncbi:MAG: CARDB domain-containing protein, partial [Chloroflexota bacterium]
RLTLPPGTTFVRAADGYLGWDFRTRHAVGFVCLHAALVVTCTGGSIAAGETGSATVYVAAPRTNGVVTSTARVDASNTIPERDETNNSAAATVTVVGRPDLTASVDHQMPAPLWLNRVVKIRNEGVTAATNVQVHVDARSYESRDLLVGISADSGLTCSAVAWATVPGGHRVTCRGGSIPAGGSARITVINTLWPAPGRRPTDVTADPRSAIEEYDEHNNTAQGGTFL